MSDLRRVSFGDSRELNREINALILEGVKTATCSAKCQYKSPDELPKTGERVLVTDFDEHPVFIIKIKSVCQKKFCDVNDTFAFKEGEGDRSLHYWRSSHKEYFQRQGIFSEEMMLVCEEFVLEKAF